MKLLFISSGNSSAGISPIVLNQGKSLEQVNDEIEIDFFTIKGKGFSGYISSVKKLRKYIKKNRFDIYHAHYSLSGFVAGLAGVKPLVVSLMGSDVKAKKWYKLIIWFFYLFSWKVTIVKSEDMKTNLGFKSLKVIPNGVNTDLFIPQVKEDCQLELGWNRSKKHILFPSNPERPEKNYNFLKEVLGLLNDDNIEVHSLVDVPHKDVPLYMNAAEVIVLTSLWEGSPNAIKEAMACNRPVVSTGVGDVEWLLSNVKGTYVTGFDIQSFAKKLKEAIGFSERFNETNGRSKLLELGLTSSNVANSLVSIYKNLINN